MPNIAEIRIALDDVGQVHVVGPLDNRLLFYGLLESARDVCCEHNRNKERRVITAPAGAMPFPGGGDKN